MQDDISWERYGKIRPKVLEKKRPKKAIGTIRHISSFSYKIAPFELWAIIPVAEQQFRLTRSLFVNFLKKRKRQLCDAQRRQSITYL